VDFIRHYSREHAGEHISCSHAEHGVIIKALEARDAGRSRQAGRRIERLIDFHSRTAGGAADGEGTL
jgi:DNA-binding GntR family transcriptional regulator